MAEEENTYKRRKTHLLIIGGLVVVNLIGFNTAVKTGGFVSSGEYIPYDQGNNLYQSLIAFVIGFPILSFILGLLFAVLPHKGLPYSKKYLRSSLLTLLTINAIFLAGHLFIILGNKIIDRSPMLDETVKEIQVSKEQRVELYKKEFLVLCDSTSILLNQAIEALDKGQDLTEVSRVFRPKLNQLESKIDNKSKALQTLATELNIGEEEYKAIISDLTQIAQPMMVKFELLKSKGFEFGR